MWRPLQWQSQQPRFQRPETQRPKAVWHVVQRASPPRVRSSSFPFPGLPSPLGPGFLSCSRLPKAPAGGARRAGDGLGVPPEGAPAPPPPSGPFRVNGPGPGGGVNRAHPRHSIERPGLWSASKSPSAHALAWAALWNSSCASRLRRGVPPW
jgi:hypothetical protein